MPACSIGFWVAITMNGCGTSCETPSTVTRPSSITSSRADWVLGEARLISSASTRWWNTGPGRNVNCDRCWSKTVTPVTSPGSRSGANWIRACEASTVLASARASMVLPVPGKSSSSRCPPVTRQASASRTTWSLPSTARSMLPTARSNPSRTQSASAWSSGSGSGVPASVTGLVEDTVAS